MEGKTKEIKAFVTNLGKYNEGYLIGQWVTFPINEDEEKELLEKIQIDGKNYEEYFVTDYEAPYGVKIDEYTSINQLNELAEKIESVSDYDQEKLEALLTEFDIDEAMEYLDDTIIYCNCYDMKDVAIEYCDETGLLDEIPDNLKSYFDFEAFGRDMSFEGTFIFFNGNCYQVIR